MTPPLHIPLSSADLEHLAKVVLPQAWEDAARAHGVDPAVVAIEFLRESGVLHWCWRAVPGPDRDLPAITRARTHLAETLERLGYAVAWETSPRVVGWAAYDKLSDAYEPTIDPTPDWLGLRVTASGYGSCSTDGHYLCVGCQHISQEAIDYRSAA